LVRNCLSREHLTKELIRAFSRRARQYICAYQAWHQQSSSNSNEITGDQNGISAHIIEKLIKKFKTHRAVIDFDNRFVAVQVKMEEEMASEGSMS
jgi:hypothetical protein